MGDPKEDRLVLLIQRAVETHSPALPTALNSEMLVYMRRLWHGALRKQGLSLRAVERETGWKHTTIREDEAWVARNDTAQTSVRALIEEAKEER